MNIRELIAHLENNYDPDEGIAYSLWSRKDIKSRAEEMELPIPTNEECDWILSIINDEHDCNYGITWGHIDAELYNFEQGEYS